MGRDSEAKLKLYQQTPGSSRRRRQGASPTPWSVAVPVAALGMWDSGAQWGTVALSQPSPAWGTCPRQAQPFPGTKELPGRETLLAAITGSSQRFTPWARTGGLDLLPVLASLGWLPHGPSHCSSWQEPRASHGFDEPQLHQLRCSEMFSQSPSRAALCSCRPCASLPASQREGRNGPHNPLQNICSYLEPVTAIPLLEATLMPNS